MNDDSSGHGGGATKLGEQSGSESVESSPTPLNSLDGLVIKTTVDKGRGIYGELPASELLTSSHEMIWTQRRPATRPISAGTVIDIAPVLFFSRDEYAEYAKHTVVDDYAFVWGDGRMALALGLGTLHVKLSLQLTII